MKNNLENIKSECAAISIWFPFVNLFVTVILVLLLELLLIITGTNVEKIYVEIIVILNCYGLVLNIKNAVICQKKYIAKTVLATLGIFISIVFVLIDIIIVFIIFANIREISFKMNVGELFSVIFCWQAIKLYLGFVKGVFREKEVVNNDNDVDIKSNISTKGDSMFNLKFYYNYGIGGEKIMSDTKELTTFSDLDKSFESFKIAFVTKDVNEKSQPVLNVWSNGNINGVDRLSATYVLKVGLFSKNIKTDEFFIEAHYVSVDCKEIYYMWFTKDIEELKSIYYEFFVNHRTPNFTNWTENIFLSD